MDPLHGMVIVIAFTKKPEPDLLYICSGEDILVTDKESFRAEQRWEKDLWTEKMKIW